MADNNSLGDFCFEDDDEASDRLCFDIDSLWDEIDDQTKSEDSMVNVASQELPKLDELPSHGIDGLGSDACSFSFNSEVSDPRAGSSEGSSNSAGKSVIFDGENQYYYEQNGTPMCTLTGSFPDWKSVTPYGSEGLTHNLSTENSDITYGSYGDLADNSSHSLGAPDIAMEFYDQNSTGPGRAYSVPSIQCSTENFGGQFVENNVEMVANVIDDFEMLQRNVNCSEDTVKFESPLETSGGTYSAAPENIKGIDYRYYRMLFDNAVDNAVGKTYSAQFLPQITSNSCSNVQSICMKDEISNLQDHVTMNGATGRKFSGADQMSCKNQSFHLKDEWYATQGSANSTTVDLDYVAERKPSEIADGLSTDKNLRQPLTGKLASTIRKSQVIAKDEISDVYFASSKANHSFVKDESCMILSPIADDPCLDSLKRPCLEQCKQLVSPKEEMDNKWVQSRSRGSYSSKGSQQTVHRDSWVQKSHVDDDPDICILEDLSEPARRPQPIVNVKLNIPSRSSLLVESHNHTDVGGVRLKTKDERLIFRAAVQDIYQPNSEANPPDGLLAVPLLKHQRIALSWMVQKETNSEHCSGGILADDQGLGKTISTIALILKERSPSSKISTNKQKMDMINLDDDDDGISNLSSANQGNVSSQDRVSGTLSIIEDTSVQHKVRGSGKAFVPL
uniref:SNF2 N-terminal domain-containing protein n=1 Tax=Daucus carota subsp. sativus TaxID=79200 RepID=A0A166F183_DAUCS